jgi:hypothetical protein
MEQLDEMRSRMDRFEKLLENLIVIQTSQNPALAAHLAPTLHRPLSNSGPTRARTQRSPHRRRVSILRLPSGLRPLSRPSRRTNGALPTTSPRHRWPTWKKETPMISSRCVTGQRNVLTHPARRRGSRRTHPVRTHLHLDVSKSRGCKGRASTPANSSPGRLGRLVSQPAVLLPDRSCGPRPRSAVLCGVLRSMVSLGGHGRVHVGSRALQCHSSPWK